MNESRLDTVAAAYLDTDAPVIMLQIDGDDRVARANAFATHLLGDPTGRTFRELVAAPDPADLPAAEAAFPGHSTAVDLHLADRTTETFHCRFVRTGDQTLLLGALDVDELLRAQNAFRGINQHLANLTRELHRKTAELERLNALKDKFLGMAAHDLRRPIGVILAYAEFLRQDLPADSELTEILEQILSASASMRELVNDFLDVSIIETGNLRLNLDRTQLAEVVGSAIKIATIAPRQNRVEIVPLIPTSLPPIFADRYKLEQVFTNIIVNAVEHSPDSSTVEVTVEQSVRQARVSVRDHGPGIPAAQQSSIFLAYESSRRGDGKNRHLGLGLAIARKIVDAHGGALAFETSQGEGTTFTVTIPVDGPPEEQP